MKWTDKVSNDIFRRVDEERSIPTTIWFTKVNSIGCLLQDVTEKTIQWSGKQNFQIKLKYLSLDRTLNNKNNNVL